MTTSTLAVERASLQPFVVIEALPAQDEQHLLALTRVAGRASAALLQGALDHATERPSYVYQLLHDDNLSRTLIPVERSALEAAYEAVKSNLIYRLQLKPTTLEELEQDELYVRRRRVLWENPDRDAFRRMGSAMLYGVARLSAGKSAHRRVRPGVK
jgi:hypothetical protein